MPPKKKDDKGKGGDKPVEEDDGQGREMVEKELVIGYLKSKLGRYQEHGDQLQIENFKLADELETQKLNLRDINEFLTNELKARSLTTSALEAKNFELNQLMEDLRKGHEAALTRLRTEKDKEADALRAMLAEYERKAKLMTDFLDRKDSLEAELNSVKAELAAKIKDYEYKLTDLDRSHIQDREKWKRETLTKIKETKIQMMKLTDNQLEMTTKRTIMENEQMSIELSYQSRQTEKLMGKNTVLMDENADLRRQISLSQQTEQELARRNNAYQKTIKSLLSKLKEQGSGQEAHDAIIRGMEEHVADVEMQLHLLSLQLDEANTHIDKLNTQLEERTQTMDSALSQYDDTARFLVQCLEDARERIVTVVHPAGQPGAAAAGSAGASGLQHTLGKSSSMLSRGSMGSAGSSRSPVAAAGPLLEPMDPWQAQALVSVVPGRLEELSAEQRERVLAYLLEKMHVHMHTQASAAALAGADSTPAGNPASAGTTHRSSVGKGVVVDVQGSSVQLPPIPAYPRRSPTSSMPISHGLHTVAPTQQTVLVPGGVMPRVPGSAHALPPQKASASPNAPGPSMPAALAGAGVAASWPLPAGGQEPVMQVLGQGAGQQGQGEVAPSGVQVEQLLTKVMSDVRPWGKKSPHSPTTTGMAGGAGRQNVFLKRGASAADSPGPGMSGSPRMVK